jgi:hypothetical protein
LAAEVKPAAATALADTLRRFAEDREMARRLSGGSVDFEADAKRLVAMEDCRKWIELACETRQGLAPCDAEAAVVSVYVEQIKTVFKDLYWAYQVSMTHRLGLILRGVLRAIRIEPESGETCEKVLQPMSAFFFSSLATCESDPNSLPSAGNREREVAKQPYAWSPGCDPLGTSVCLLLSHQVGYVRRSKALLGSPLAFHLRWENMARIVRVERPFCNRCRKYFPQRGLAGKCPECRKPLTVRREWHLVSTGHLEDLMGQGAAGIVTTFGVEIVAARASKEIAARQREGSPSDELELAEEIRKEGRIVFRKAKRLWHATMGGGVRDLRKKAVLLGLTGLEFMPELREWARPKPGWLKGIVHHLGGGSLKGDGLAGRSRRMLAQISDILHMKEQAELTAGNVRAIVSRFRKPLQGKC